MPSGAAQSFITEAWEERSGLPDTLDWSNSAVDASGNVYLTSNTLVSGQKANIITTKYNASHALQWQVTYNSGSNDNDYGIAITVDGSGNVYVAAASYTSGTNNYDYRVIKYNSSGTSQWNVTYNGTGSSFDIPADILVDGSGNVYVTGLSYGSGSALADYLTIKYNSSGTSQWTARYNHGHQDVAVGLSLLSSGRIVVTGGSEAATDNWDFFTMKYNQSTGAKVDSIRNSAAGVGFDKVYGLAIDQTDHIILAGTAAVTGHGEDIQVIKLDSTLSTSWSHTYDLENKDDAATAVAVDLDNTIYVTGCGVPMLIAAQVL